MSIDVDEVKQCQYCCADVTPPDGVVAFGPNDPPSRYLVHRRCLPASGMGWGPEDF